MTSDVHTKNTKTALYHTIKNHHPIQTLVFRIRLMFEWGGGSLWYGNKAALKQFDVGPIEEILPLSKLALGRLSELSQCHGFQNTSEASPRLSQVS